MPALYGSGIANLVTLSSRRGVLRPGETRRAVAAWLGSLLFLANILFAPLLGYRPMVLSAEEGLVICTSEGRVVLDSSGRTLPEKPAQDQHVCAFCLPLSSPEAGLLGAAASVPPLSGSWLAVSFLPAPDQALTPAARPGGYARGPPAAA
jgi:hypothetical protein